MFNKTCVYPKPGLSKSSFNPKSEKAGTVLKANLKKLTDSYIYF